MDIVNNLKEIKDRIEKAAIRSGRNPESVKLLAVTKTHPAEVVAQAIKAGVEFIGENKVQEAEEKLLELGNSYKEFHYIGHLQTNKVKKVLALKPALLHSVDSLRLAEKIDNEAEKLGIVQDILLQVNTSGEASKFGTDPEAAFKLAEEVSHLKNIQIKGLMTIGRFTEDTEEVRRSFRLLKEIGREMSSITGVQVKWYSMGMTHDFEIAIEEGSNLVRIGTAIFGAREYKGK